MQRGPGRTQTWVLLPSDFETSRFAPSSFVGALGRSSSYEYALYVSVAALPRGCVRDYGTGEAVLRKASHTTGPKAGWVRSLSIFFAWSLFFFFARQMNASHWPLARRWKDIANSIKILIRLVGAELECE